MFIKKAFRFLTVGFYIGVLCATNVSAQDMTAINFSGDVIGKVIPDGTAINLKNEIIGQLNADSFILNSKGDVIGGIVPQGFVIGNDHKYLGKVLSDGSVRLPSGRTAGRVLPSGLAVNDNFEVIGGVLSSGIIYNDKGEAVGRLSGNGAYINFEGKNIGFVSADGYAYRKNEAGYALDGRIITSKTAVDNQGKFIGSILPGGRVTDSEGAIIGQIHANGYVYDPDGQIIGKSVQNAYAFENDGRYISLVGFNGEVIKDGKIFGHLRPDWNIINEEGQIIGFAIPLNAVAVDEKGSYLGYVVPTGKVIKGSQKEVGNILPRGKVADASGQVIGQIASLGPVFDVLGEIKGNTALNGQVVSLDGANLGYMKGNLAYDSAGFLLGGVVNPSLIISTRYEILGMTGIDSAMVINGAKYNISPMGYFMSADGRIAGSMLPLSPFYEEDGTILSYIDSNGRFEIAEGRDLRLDSNGFALDEKNNLKAAQIHPKEIVLFDQNKKLKLSATNLLYDKDQATAKIVPEYQIIGSAAKDALMPIVGESFDENGPVLNVKGELIGYLTPKGDVFYHNAKEGEMHESGFVYNDKNIFIGAPVAFETIVNASCEPIGVVGLRGEARNLRNNLLGKVLLNGQSVSETGQYIGHTVLSGPVYGFKGELIGTTNQLGLVLNAAKQSEGCLNASGILYDESGVYKGRIAQNAFVMAFDGKIIGRTNLNNAFINQKGDVVGTISPDGTVKDDKENILGIAFLYRFAFDRQNNFVGRVAYDGQVYDDKGNVFGQVKPDGLITSKNRAVGYALYDLYIYNDKGEVIGYLTKNGAVVDFSGNNLGKADRGFLVSKDGKLIGRGNRDYVVRNKKDEAVGVLNLDGELIGFDGELIGEVSNSGEVRDKSTRLVATARPLQFYIMTSRTGAAGAQNQSDLQVEPITVPEDKPLNSYTQKVIGVVVSPDGKYLGDLLENGVVIDPNTGEIIGYGKDGLVFDEYENLIGTVETQKPTGNKGQVSSGIYLPPDAYGTSDKPSNLGPGGGFGPNERYDPVRARLLAEAQNIRQGSIRVGKLSSNVNPSSFTGYQDNWDDANYVISSWRVDMSEMILADKPIPAVLARTIMDSGAASNVPVTAIVERNVYAEDGRNIVIPAGSRVMGQSAGGATGGTSGSAVRMDITWTRLIRPDGSAFEFTDAQTGDAQGRGGALGYLDQQLLKKYTLPMATSLMSDALAYVMARGKTTTSSDGSTTQDSRSQAAEDAREHFLDNMDQIFQELMQQKTSIAAVTYIPAGTRLIIYPKVDMWLRTAEREQQDSFGKSAAMKPDMLIDDTNPMGSINEQSKASNRASASRGSPDAKVVYDGNDGNVQPSSAPLIDDSQYAPQKRPTGNIGYTPPPPSTSAKSSSSSSSSQPADASSGQLF